MQDVDEIIVEVLPRLETAIPDRWPVSVPPARDELLSSWLHRIALAHGLSPRRFGQALGFDKQGWPAAMDNVAPAWLLNLLHAQTGQPVERIAAMTIGFEPWFPLALPMRWHTTVKNRSIWLQFCPSCLAEDKEPYFRRRWRRATCMICPQHRRVLRDRCPRCKTGIAALDQRAMLPQHRCATCCHDLRDVRGPIANTSSRLDCELIEGLVAAEGAKGLLGRSALVSQILTLPSSQERSRLTKFTGLSPGARVACLAGAAIGKHLMVDPNPAISAWRESVIAGGGAFRCLKPLVRLMSDSLIGKKRTMPKNPRGKDAREINLLQLFSAYHEIAVRRHTKD